MGRLRKVSKKETAGGGSHMGKTAEEIFGPAYRPLQKNGILIPHNWVLFEDVFENPDWHNMPPRTHVGFARGRIRTYLILVKNAERPDIISVSDHILDLLFAGIRLRKAGQADKYVEKPVASDDYVDMTPVYGHIARAYVEWAWSLLLEFGANPDAVTEQQVQFLVQGLMEHPPISASTQEPYIPNLRGKKQRDLIADFNRRQRQRGTMAETKRFTQRNESRFQVRPGQNMRWR